MKNNKTRTLRNIIIGIIAGAATAVAVFMILINTVLTIEVDFDEPAIMRVVECPIYFTDLYGCRIDTGADGEWELGANQDVLVWFEIPNGIDQLNANITSVYPYEVLAGETGTIELEAYCFGDGVKYVGSLEFTALDDLTLGAVRNINHGNARVEVENSYDEHCIHYPLYTSCSGKYNVYRAYGGLTSVGYDVKFDINPIGAPEMVYGGGCYLDGSIELETEARRSEWLRSISKERETIEQEIQRLNEMLRLLDSQEIESGKEVNKAD